MPEIQRLPVDLKVPPSMQSTTHRFKTNVYDAFQNKNLQQSLAKLPTGLSLKRTEAVAKLPEFDALRDEARDIKNHTLAHLDLYLEAYEAKVTASGGHVHYASTPQEARDLILGLCRTIDVPPGRKQRVTKGKSMITEEIGLNAHLEEAGLQVTETDLGEYLIQIRGETPSHIIAPAIHLTQAQIVEDFRRLHAHLPKDRQLEEPAQLVDEARTILRERFLSADVGITGANFLIAETGSSVIVTNEGNGDLTQSLSKMHIVVASIEKLVPTLEDTATLLRVLARSATGQEISTYTTFSTGPRRIGGATPDPDGPEAYHVVILDNGRSELLGTDLREALRCIRCGACMNHCPVYGAIGGHAYGWVYPGPIGAVLTPALFGVKTSADLPHASTFCGRCEEVCPVRIPLPKLLRYWRTQDFEQGGGSRTFRASLNAWAWMARHPRLYHLGARLGMPVLAWLGRKSGAFKRLPLAGGWTRHRDLPAPQGGTFQAQWKARQAGKGART
jgi:L-lactate dehydrogenase complex protein LldF